MPITRDRLGRFAKSGSGSSSMKERVSKYGNTSKIVDADGKPLKMYHGTNSKFKEFNTGDPATIKFGDRIIDNTTSSTFFTSEKQVAQSHGKRLITAELDVRNPYVNKIGNPQPSISKLKAMGHDGIVSKTPSGKIFNVEVFNKKQIKIKKR